MKKSTTILLLLVAALITGGLAVEMYQQHRVESFFRQFVSLQLGTTSFEDVQRLAVQYGAKYSGTQLQNPCTAQDCVVTFTFSNWIFHHLQRDREVSLAAGLFIKDGHLTSKEINFSIASHSRDHDYLYVLFDRSRPEDSNGYRINRPRVDAQAVAHYVVAELGSNAPDKLRNGAYLVNLRCLTRILGCDSQADVVPEVWR
jgi:hypothetical protein